MGSSTASETTINTSTDSANTMLTMVTTTDGEQPDDSFDLMDIPSEMSPSTTAASSMDVPLSESILPAPLPSSPPIPSSSSPSIEYSTEDEKGFKICPPLTDTGLKSDIPITCLDIRASSISNLLDETDAPSIDSTPIIIHSTVNETIRVSVSGRTPPLPDLRTTDFFSTPVRGSIDAGQPEKDSSNSMLTLIVGRSRENENRENRLNDIVSNERKYEEGKLNVNVTTNPLDISLIEARTNNNQSSDSSGRPSSTSTKSRRKTAGKSQ
uniref:Rad and Gem related GTP binding protein 1 n=1 Tax=Apis cerana TaxID=7461 RepID=V9ICQ3_APICE